MKTRISDDKMKETKEIIAIIEKKGAPHLAQLNRLENALIDLVFANGTNGPTFNVLPYSHYGDLLTTLYVRAVKILNDWDGKDVDTHLFGADTPNINKSKFEKLVNAINALTIKMTNRTIGIAGTLINAFQPSSNDSKAEATIMDALMIERGMFSSGKSSLNTGAAKTMLASIKEFEDEHTKYQTERASLKQLTSATESKLVVTEKNPTTFILFDLRDNLKSKLKNAQQPTPSNVAASTPPISASSTSSSSSSQSISPPVSPLPSATTARIMNTPAPAPSPQPISLVSTSTPLTATSVTTQTVSLAATPPVILHPAFDEKEDKQQRTLESELQYWLCIYQSGGVPEDEYIKEIEDVKKRYQSQSSLIEQKLSDHEMVTHNDILSLNMMMQAQYSGSFFNNGFGIGNGPNGTGTGADETNEEYLTRINKLSSEINKAQKAHPKVKVICLQEAPTNEDLKLEGFTFVRSGPRGTAMLVSNEYHVNSKIDINYHLQQDQKGRVQAVLLTPKDSKQSPRAIANVHLNYSGNQEQAINVLLKLGFTVVGDTNFDDLSSRRNNLQYASTQNRESSSLTYPKKMKDIDCIVISNQPLHSSLFSASAQDLKSQSPSAAVPQFFQPALPALAQQPLNPQEIAVFNRFLSQLINNESPNGVFHSGNYMKCPNVTFTSQKDGSIKVWGGGVRFGAPLQTLIGGTVQSGDVILSPDRLRQAITQLQNKSNNYAP